MKVEIKRTFEKDFARIPHSVRPKVTEFLLQISGASHIQEIHNTKKLVGFREFYRTRIGDYRIGFRYLDEIIIVDRVLHRKDIYRNYP